MNEMDIKENPLEMLRRIHNRLQAGFYHRSGDKGVWDAERDIDALCILANKLESQLYKYRQAESEGRIVPNIKEGQVFISQNSVVEHAHWSGDLWMDSLNGLHFVFHEANDGYDWQVEAKYVHSTFEAAEAALAAKGGRGNESRCT